MFQILRGIVLIAAVMLGSKEAAARDVCNCKGYAGRGGPCYAGPGGLLTMARAVQPMLVLVVPATRASIAPHLKVQMRQY